MSRKSNQELREDYLYWLEMQLSGEYGEPGKTYSGLATLMFDIPFEYSHPMDGNRIGDGLDLRVEFARENRFSPKSMEKFGPGSFLEVLIGLSRQMAFIAGGNAIGWAWELLHNLELHRLSDPLTPSKQRKAEEIIYAAMQRTYLPDGTGGFFPLTRPDGDQTQIELWYQMNAYIEELHPEH
ncbi:MAG: hypothetical protein ACJ8BW_08330 [Ktedonobacteraceae bacterium]